MISLDKFENGSCLVKNKVVGSNFVYALEATLSGQYSLNLVTVFVVMISSMRLEMPHVGLNTRPLGEIIEEPMLVTKGFWFKI